MGVALSIVFTGLCALVADSGGEPGQMLLVDASGIGEVGGVRLPRHAPTLTARLATLANAGASEPTQVVVSAAGEQIGLWDLTGAEVRIRVPGGAREGLRLHRSANEGSSWPQPPQQADDPAAWRDLRFVADMGALAGDGRIDPALVANEDLDPAPLPKGVAARVHLETGVLEAGRPSEESYRDDVFEFRAAQAAPALRQALTDSIRWRLETPADAVMVEILSAAGGPPKRLVLAASALPHALSISNMPASDRASEARHAASHEEMAALHFGAYYELLMNPPSAKPLPRLWRPAGRRGAGMGWPVFCPPAVFSRR